VYPVPEPSFTARDLGEVMECLSEHNLVFPVAISRDDIYPWKTINSTLHEQLGIHNYTFTLYDGDVGEQFTRLSWDILAQKKSRKGKNVKLTFQAGLAGPSTFTIQFLCEQALSVEIENPINDHPFILIG
jgi:hypothetical protein